VEPEHRDQFARTKMLLLAALRGSIILYQGEELGLTQVEVPFELLQDPEAIANWPQTLSRDGVRTPIPWCACEPGHGFTEGRPWLPVGSDHAALSVDAQADNERSLLHHTRAVLAFRNAQPALRWGALEMVEAGEHKRVFDGCMTQPVALHLQLSPFDLPPCSKWQAHLRHGSADSRHARRLFRYH
jgi:alpha-glucosidase